MRLAAVRALVGQRGYRGALPRVEAVINGKDVDDRDLTERMAFFEAYGAIAGASAIETLRGLLWPRGFLRAKVDPETRACAAVALGRIKSPEAREALQKCADDKELVVRTAVSSALRRRRSTDDPGSSAAPDPERGRALRSGGRGFLLGLLRRAPRLKLYPVENATVQRSLDDLHAAGRALLEPRGEIEIRLAGDFIFVNGTRLRLELDNYASFCNVLTLLRAFEIGSCGCARQIERREWQAFLSIAAQPGCAADGTDRFDELAGADDAGRGRRALGGARAGRRRRGIAGRSAEAPRKWPSGPTPRAWPSPRTWSTACGFGRATNCRRSSGRCS